jgi:hypothetical protein
MLAPAAPAPAPAMPLPEKTTKPKEGRRGTLAVVVAGSALAAVAILGGVSGFNNATVRQRECGPGLVARDTGCAPLSSPTDQYARCIIQDVRQRTTGETRADVAAKLKSAQDSASTALNLKQNFERTIEKNADMCIVLDVSAKCYALASHQPAGPLPEPCRGGVRPAPSP